jgi:hypothetical protein
MGARIDKFIEDPRKELVEQLAAATQETVQVPSLWNALRWIELSGNRSRSTTVTSS